MLIRLDKDTIYNSETGCCIHRTPFNPYYQNTSIANEPTIGFDGE